MLSPTAERRARGLQAMLDAGTLPRVRAGDALAGTLGDLDGDLELAVRIVLADADHLDHVARTHPVLDAHYSGHRRDVEDQLADLWLAATTHAGPNGGTRH